MLLGLTVASVMLKLGNPTTGSLTMMIPIGALTTGFATAEMTTFSWTWETFSSSSACLGIPALGAGGAVQGGSGGEDKCRVTSDTSFREGYFIGAFSILPD